MREEGCSVEFLCQSDCVAVGDRYSPGAFYASCFVNQFACLDEFYGSRIRQPFDLFSSFLPAYISTENVFSFCKRLESCVRVDNIPLYRVPERLGKIRRREQFDQDAAVQGDCSAKSRIARV
jgi:hypothetical protein